MRKINTDYYAIALGNGTAGVRFAKELCARGLKSAVCGTTQEGSTCINAGCMPTKALLEITHRLHQIQNAHSRSAGILVQDVSLDFKQLMAYKDREVDYFSQCKARDTAKAGVDVLIGRAHFNEDGTLEIGDTAYRAQKYLVATGSIPKILPIPGIEQVKVLTSTEALSLKEQPRSLVVQGAGPIALELAQFFARIDTQVLLISRSPLLHHFDNKAGAELTRILEAEPNLTLAIGHKILQVSSGQHGGVSYKIRGPLGQTYQHKSSHLLIAVGRRPALDNLGLENIGIKLIDGLIPIDQYMRACANHNVFVAGDATGERQILHIANLEAEVAAHNAAVQGWHSWLNSWAGFSLKVIDYDPMIQAIFTDPPFVQVGMSERSADLWGPDVVVTERYFGDTGRAHVMGAEHGIIRLICDARDLRILGATILGPRADDFGHTAAALIKFGAKRWMIRDLPWYHPTISEVIKDLAPE